MKNSYLFILDQLIFSLANFLVFIAIDSRFSISDASSFAILMSTSALLLNFGFAVFLERHVVKDERVASIAEFALLFVAILFACVISFLLFFPKNDNNDILIFVLIFYSFFWVCKRFLILVPNKIKISILINSLFLLVSLLMVLMAGSYREFLELYITLIIIACIFTLFNCKLSWSFSLGSVFKAIFLDKKLFFYSLCLVPLLWFPSNGIYILLSYVGSSVALVEARKLLMLISPVQQIGSALINSIFSQGRTEGNIRKKYLYLYPLYIALLASSGICFVYYYFLDGSAGLFLWISIVVIAFSMLSASQTQAKLRVVGKQQIVVSAYLTAAATKISLFLLLYGIYKAIDLEFAVGIMAVSYFSVIFFFWKARV